MHQTDSKKIADELHREVVDSLIEATPEWWTFAQLDLLLASDGNHDRCAHSIMNPDNPRDIVEPTDELYAATRKLVLHAKNVGAVWKTASYKVWQTEDGRWRFTVDFHYD